MRCPSGEDPECPIGEFCFAYTGCQAELGYPDGRPPMKGENVTVVDDDGDEDEAKEDCVDLKVTITPDDWPQETTWTVTNEAGDEVVAGTNDGLSPGEEKVWNECIPKKQCYEFTVKDSGGDGLCCDHGDGSYKFEYNGKEIKSGAAFYDLETTEFGLCGETWEPTGVEASAPSKAPIQKMTTSNVSGGGGGGGGGGNDGGTRFRCVDKDLLARGYRVQASLCSEFTDCYNEFIDQGDDWFCSDGQECFETSSCGVTEVVEAIEETIPAVSKPATPASRPTEVRPRPVPSAKVPVTAPPVATVVASTSAPSSAQSTNEPSSLRTDEPSSRATSEFPTMTPTTSMPTLGQCDGEPCPQSHFCRSQYGFCGPAATYCNEKSIWNEECSTNGPSPSPTVAKVAFQPEMQKPSGASKPSGGKKPALAKPAVMNNSATLPPTEAATGYSTWLIFGSSQNAEPATESPAAPSGFINLSSGSGSIQVITSPPTASTLEMQANSEILDTSSAATDEEDISCTGEPCEEQSWCRSKYGSCGPGQIYCNTNSIWMKSCPPVAPGTRPTKTPTPKPSALFDSQEEEAVSTPVSSPGMPTLPDLPKPTLPHIHEAAASSFLTQSYAAYDANADISLVEETDGQTATAVASKDEEEKKDVPKKPSSGTTFQSATYLTDSEWADWTISGCSKSIPLNAALAVLSALMLIF